jgi:hypothetical protein
MFTARTGLVAVALTLLLAPSASALSPFYLACQRIKSASLPPTLGCPAGTIYVAQNDSRAHFTSVQAAVDSL